MSRSDVWQRRGHGGSVVRIAGLALGAGLFALLCGCPYLADVLAYNQTFENWLASTETWPDVSVRIVNETSATAHVHLISAGFAPEAPAFLSYAGEGDYYYPLVERSVLVGPDGTASGTLKCGEVLGLAVKAPFDLDAALFVYITDTSDPYNLYLEPGNCALDGVGVSPSAFTGDTYALVRYVRPVEDGLDCATQTLVITITAAGRPSVVNPDTGEVTSSARLGAATVSIE